MINDQYDFIWSVCVRKRLFGGFWLMMSRGKEPLWESIKSPFMYRPEMIRKLVSEVTFNTDNLTCIVNFDGFDTHIICVEETGPFLVEISVDANGRKEAEIKDGRFMTMPGGGV